MARLERLAPLAGVAFLILIAAAFAVGGETPNSDDPTGKIVKFWRDDDTKQAIAGYLGGLAALFLVWFAGSLRRTIARAGDGEDRLGTIAFTGAAFVAIGLLIFGSLSFATATTAGDVPPDVTHTLTVLGNELFFPLAGGAALLLGAAGLAFVRTRVLPAWLGWVSIALAVLALTPVGFFVLLAMILWVAALGIVLYLHP